MRPLRPSTPLSYLLRQPATHRISSNSAYVTWCGRGYAPHHKPIRGTTDPAKVTCGSCRRSRLNKPAPKNVTPRS
jgi:hypothetical protein